MGRKLDDLTGRTFGRTTVTKRVASVNHSTRYECLCSCGTVHTSPGSSLRSGHTKSCGCLRREVTAQTGAKTGPVVGLISRRTHGLAHHPHYTRWADMMFRCYRESCVSFPDYGGRGLRVYEPWHDVAAFCKWMDENLGDCPEGMSFDRINNDFGYGPTNVRWATYREQMANRRTATSL